MKEEEERGRGSFSFRSNVGRGISPLLSILKEAGKFVFPPSSLFSWESVPVPARSSHLSPDFCHLSGAPMTQNSEIWPHSNRVLASKVKMGVPWCCTVVALISKDHGRERGKRKGAERRTRFPPRGAEPKCTGQRYHVQVHRRILMIGCIRGDIITEESRDMFL